MKLYNDTFFNYLEWYLIKQLGYFVARREDQLWMAEHIDDIDILDESIASLAKINWCYGSFKKYDKVQGTYLNGTHFTDSKIECDYFDEQGVTPNRYDKKGVFKSYLMFNANEKKSKRWSSAFHTIPSKSEMKRIVTTPPGYLMSYFDISGAEIRTISFTSGDPFMMQCYKEGKDPLNI